MNHFYFFADKSNLYTCIFIIILNPNPTNENDEKTKKSEPKTWFGFVLFGADGRT